jgi:hypothetical protein
MRRKYEQNREEARGEWRKLYLEDLHELYFLPNVNGVTKLSRLR